MEDAEFRQLVNDMREAQRRGDHDEAKRLEAEIDTAMKANAQTTLFEEGRPNAYGR